MLFLLLLAALVEFYPELVETFQLLYRLYLVAASWRPSGGSGPGRHPEGREESI